jgi:hypothetical protein
MGWSIIASISWSSVKAGSSKPSSAKGVPFSRSSWRGVRPNWRSSSVSSARLGGVLRYSMTRGSMPALRIIASVLREVPQSAL